MLNKFSSFLISIATTAPPRMELKKIFFVNEKIKISLVSNFSTLIHKLSEKETF